MIKVFLNSEIYLFYFFSTENIDLFAFRITFYHFLRKVQFSIPYLDVKIYFLYLVIKNTIGNLAEDVTVVMPLYFEK